MADSKKPTRQSTGPRTRAGKARSAMNAVRHGSLSSTLLLAGESRDAFDLLAGDLALDLRPVGALEHILVDKIAAVLWRKRRLEGAEQAALSSAQMKPVTVDELKSALGLDGETLPNWMLDEDNVPTEAAGKKAIPIADAWAQIRKKSMVQTPEQETPTDYPALRAKINAAIERGKLGGSVEPSPEMLAAQAQAKAKEEAMAKMAEQEKSKAAAQEKAYWIAYWHRNRDKMAAAFRAIRVKHMLGEWDLDRAHRYHTMLDNQLFRLLREFRAMREWRLDNLDMAGEDSNEAPRAETVMGRVTAAGV